MADQLATMMEDLDINGESTRSRAARAKKANPDFHACALCFHKFHTHNLLGKHFKLKHRAKAQEIKAEFHEASDILKENPEDEIAIGNYKISLLKVTMLETFRL